MMAGRGLFGSMDGWTVVWLALFVVMKDEYY